MRAMPGTLVAFHAHPDDEVITTGGVMARAAAAGTRVVLVIATGGELGEVADGFLDDGEELAARRAIEVARAGEILGVARIEFLGYGDSGMEGEATNTRRARSPPRRSRKPRRSSRRSCAKRTPKC